MNQNPISSLLELEPLNTSEFSAETQSPSPRQNKRSEDTPLLQSLEIFSQTLKRYGFDVLPYTSAALEKLNTVPEEKKQAIREFFELWNQWITPESSDGAEPIPLDAKKEQAFAEKALRHYKLDVDSEFWKTLKDDHVIEIYGQDMMQLHRSLSFFKYCGYSLLDISVNEWYVLWNRPTQIIRAMEEQVMHTLQNNLSVQGSLIPLHLLTETLNVGEHEVFVPRATLVNFQYIGVIRGAASQMPQGFICTSAARLMMKGETALDIGFI